MLGDFRVSQLLAAGSCALAVLSLIVLQFMRHEPLLADRLQEGKEETVPEEPEV